jgi:ADP-ribose pyrophosphatase YjhB (NUDIX family)
MTPDHDHPRPVPVVRLIVPDAAGRDTVEEAAIRELEEETALRTTRLRFLFYQDSLPNEPGRMHCINLYFLCETEGVLEINDESAEATWIDRNDLDKYTLVFRNAEALTRYWAGQE